MKKIITQALVLLTTVSAQAAKISKPDCKEIATISDRFTPQYVAVVDGYNKSDKKQGEVVDVAGIVSESTEIKQQCQKQQSKAMQTVKSDIEKNKPHMAKTDSTANSASKINPVKASCQEFLTLGDAYQPVAVYWVAGHDKSGKVIKEGEVDEEFLSRPIAVLVQDCKANPTASFYSRAKTWISAKL